MMTVLYNTLTYKPYTAHKIEEKLYFYDIFPRANNIDPRLEDYGTFLALHFYRPCVSFHALRSMGKYASCHLFTYVSSPGSSPGHASK